MATADQPAQQELIDEMQQLYAAYQSVAAIAQGAHRNVTGSLFSELHTFLGRVYSEISDSSDKVGEKTRGLDIYQDLPVGLEALAARSPISSEIDGRLTEIDSSQIFAREAYFLEVTYQAHFKLIKLLANAQTMAASVGRYGLQNFLCGEIDAADDRDYWFKSFRTGFPLSSGRAEGVAAPSESETVISAVKASNGKAPR